MKFFFEVQGVIEADDIESAEEEVKHQLSDMSELRVTNIMEDVEDQLEDSGDDVE